MDIDIRCQHDVELQKVASAHKGDVFATILRMCCTTKKWGSSAQSSDGLALSHTLTREDSVISPETEHKDIDQRSGGGFSKNRGKWKMLELCTNLDRNHFNERPCDTGETGHLEAVLIDTEQRQRNHRRGLLRAIFHVFGRSNLFPSHRCYRCKTWFLMSANFDNFEARANGM